MGYIVKNRADLRKEVFLQDFFDTSDDIFVQLTLDFLIDDCNIAFCQLQNKPRKKLLKLSFYDFLPSRLNINLDDIINTTNVNEQFLTLIDYEKNECEFEINLRKIKDRDSILSGYFVQMKRVLNSQKNKEEDKLDKKMQSLLKSMIFSLNRIYTVITTTNDGEIDYVNPTVESIFGYTHDELKGKPIHELYCTDGENKVVLDKMFKELNEKNYFIGEVNQVTKSGEVIPFYLSVSSLVSDGKTVGRLGIGRDLRDLKKLEVHNQYLAINLSNQSKLAEFGRALQGVAHNLNTPLTGIKSSAQLQEAKLKKMKKTFENKYGNDEEMLKAIESIQKSASLVNKSSGKMAKIISNMMAKARNQQSVEKEMINLSKIMSQEVEFLMADMEFKHDIEKIFDFENEVPDILGLYSDFSQIFVNLIKNAMDAMFNVEEKSIKISIVADEENIIVKIKDSGKGISEDIGDKIFEPFFTTKPKLQDVKNGEPAGNGIGLDSVVSTLEQYHGTISYKSEVGKGTEFIILIPIEKNKREK